MYEYILISFKKYPYMIFLKIKSVTLSRIVTRARKLQLKLFIGVNEPIHWSFIGGKWAYDPMIAEAPAVWSPYTGCLQPAPDHCLHHTTVPSGTFLFRSIPCQFHVSFTSFLKSNNFIQSNFKQLLKLSEIRSKYSKMIAEIVKWVLQYQLIAAVPTDCWSTNWLLKVAGGINKLKIIS